MTHTSFFIMFWVETAIFFISWVLYFFLIMISIVISNNIICDYIKININAYFFYKKILFFNIIL